VETPVFGRQSTCVLRSRARKSRRDTPTAAWIPGRAGRHGATSHRAGRARTYGSREDNPTAYRQLDHELATIDKLTSRYFLIVHDIVEFCRRENIYCQGRGSAANSAVCYALGITNVDAVRRGLLFERCLSPERDWPRVPGVRSFPLADARPAPRH